MLNIRHGEGRLVFLLLAYSFVIGAARIFTRSAAMGLFLSKYDATMLPYVYIGISIMAVVLSLSYLKLGQWLALSRLLMVTLGFLLVVSVSIWLGLVVTGAGWLYFSLPIWYEVLWTLTNLAFWNLVGRILNVRQGKRLFGVVSTGEGIALLLGGLLIPLLLDYIEAQSLFLVAAAALAGAGLVLVSIRHSFRQRLDLSLPKVATKVPEAATGNLKNRYVLLLCHLFGLTITTFFFIDAIFYAQAEIRFADEEALTSFVGLFFGIAGLLGLLSRLFVAGWLVQRFGVRVGAMVEPVAVGAGLVGLAIVINLPTALLLPFWLASLTKLVSQVFGESTNPVTFNIFYQPLPPLRRTQVQTLVEGVVYPVAIGLAGVGLALLNDWLQIRAGQLVIFTLALLLFWIFTIGAVTRLYPVKLREALFKRQISGEGLRLDDETSVAVLLQFLHNPRPAVALHALTLLEKSGSSTLVDSLSELLDHPAPEVRLAALRAIERHKVIPALTKVARYAHYEPEPMLRAAALRTLVALGQKESVEHIYPYIDDPSLQVQAEVIVGLLRYTGIELAMMAEGRLLSLAVSERLADRIQAARIVGQVPGRNLEQLLVQMLQDPDIDVRRAALMAAGELQQPEVWPLVIAELATPIVHNTAAAALVAGGEAVLPQIVSAFKAPTQTTEVRQRLARVCARIGGSRAVTFLFEHLDWFEAAVRTQIMAGLGRMHFRAQEVQLEPVRAQFHAEVAEITLILAQLVALEQEFGTRQTNGGVILLHSGLMRKLQQARTRLFWLLSYIYPPSAILQVRDNLALAATDKRAYAIEMLDLTLAAEFKQPLLALIEPLSSREQLRRLSHVFPSPPQSVAVYLQQTINALPGQASDWEKACAIYAAGELELLTSEMLATIEPLAQVKNYDQLLSETAAVTLACSSSNRNGGRPMLSTIEKVLVLKTVNLFETTPDDILAEIAVLLTELELLAGETIFEKGEPGDCMYIIISGRVKAHDDDLVFNHLTEGQVFGEMALLDPEPRVASITAVEDTRLLRLDRQPFFELMEDRIEVARGVIQVLSNHLRHRVKDVADLKEQLRALRRS